MRSLQFVSLLLILFGCKEQPTKNYEDYDEEDFIEVQGLIVKVEKEFAYQERKIDVTYIYNLEKDKPSIGYEEDSPFIPMAGEPAIILVHKYEDGITFFGGPGYVEHEDNIIKRYLEKSEHHGVEYYGFDENY